jgi:hypothetical protein
MMGNFMKITPAAAVNILTYFADEIAKGVEPVFTSIGTIRKRSTRGRNLFARKRYQEDKAST